MYSFNPLFKNSFFGSDTGFPGRGHGLGQYHAPGQVKSPNSTSAPSSVAQIERTLALAYEKLQVTATRGSAAAESGTAAPAETDFSPQAVTDRILGFVRDRLETERANGASEAKIKDLYQQAVSGVERGLREAKDIIQAQFCQGCNGSGNDGCAGAIPGPNRQRQPNHSRQRHSISLLPDSPITNNKRALTGPLFQNKQLIRVETGNVKDFFEPVLRPALR